MKFGHRVAWFRYFFLLVCKGIPWWLRGWSICLPCRRPGFYPWVGKILWRRKWQPTPVFLPGESHGQRSLAGYSPWGRKKSDTTERVHFTSLHCHITCLLRNLYAGQEATFRTGHGTMDCFKIGKSCILVPCLFDLYAECIMRNAVLDKAQAGIRIAGRNINNLRYADDTTLMAESEEECKSFWWKWKKTVKKLAQHSEN